MKDFEKYARRFKKAADHFLVDTIVNQTGFNAHIPGKTVSFHYKAKSVGEGTAVFRSNSKKFPPGSELAVWKELIGYKEPETVKTKGVQPNINHVNGTQQCIDHINNKIELIKKDEKRDNNQLLTMLTNLTHELKQYL